MHSCVTGDPALELDTDVSPSFVGDPAGEHLEPGSPHSKQSKTGWKSETGGGGSFSQKSGEATT